MISVIVPIYNVEFYLKDCIESICNQTYRDLEIILVDDGSVDSSGTICDDYAELDKRITVIHQKNQGVVNARKAGMNIAQGEFIAFVDGDDWIEPTLYKDLLFEVGSNEFELLTFGCIQDYSDCSKEILNLAETGLYTEEKLEFCREKLLLSDKEWWLFPRMWNKLIKRDLLKKYMNDVPDHVVFAEDAACILPCMMEAKTIFVSNNIAYHYRQREGSAVKRVEDLSRENFIAIYSLLKKAFANNDELIRRLHKYIASLMLIKSYTAFKDIMPLTPFDRIREGDSIFVYGAGDFGRVIVDYIERFNVVKLVGWTDKRAKYLKLTDIRIEELNSLVDKEYNFLIIAILNDKVASNVKLDLLQKGVPEEKINLIKYDTLEKLMLPEWLK